MGRSATDDFNCGKYVALILIFYSLTTGAPAGAPAAAPQSRASQPGAHATTQLAKPEEVSQLRPGAPVERELKGGEAHAYRLTLEAGQYAKVVVEQKGIDVAVALFDAGGQKLSEVDKDPAIGRESIFAVADAAGEYRLVVRSVDKDAKPGSYSVKFEGLREATQRDRVQCAAERAYEEGSRLRDERTAESRRKAVGKYEESLALWREAGDQRCEAYTLNDLGVISSILGEPAKAISCYSQAASLWHAAGDRLNTERGHNAV